MPPFITRAPLTAASNSYIVNVGGQSTILSPGSNTHLQWRDLRNGRLGERETQSETELKLILQTKSMRNAIICLR